MLPLLSRDAVRALDADAVARLGLPSLVLMENAGRGAFDVIARRYSEHLDRVVVVGGVGQNGGDAWVIARHLQVAGKSPRCVLIGNAADVRGDAKVNWDVLAALGLSPMETHAMGALDALLADATLVVDGLFGTGLTRTIEGDNASAIAAINAVSARGVPVVALDLPSGIHADTGAVLGAAVRASLTVTFAARKVGLYQFPGAEHAADVECVPIGVPVPIDAPIALIERADVAAALPLRRRDSHKGSAGHVLIVAGSLGTSGAAALCALGALRMGAGLVTVFTRATGHEITERYPEIMVRTLSPSLEAACAEVLAFSTKCASAIVGPGLGLDDFGTHLARRLASELAVPTLLDADALTALGTELRRAGAQIAPRVITPHPGEASRLLGQSTAALQGDRVTAVRTLARESGAVAVLKGAGTVVALADGNARVCDRGTPALGVAGTGDVLAGAIGALLGQLPAIDAAASGVYLHAFAGELAAEQDRGLLASEVAAALPKALASCRD